MMAESPNNPNSPSPRPDANTGQGSASTAPSAGGAGGAIPPNVVEIVSETPLPPPRPPVWRSPLFWAISLVVIGIPFAVWYCIYRTTHALTDDCFVTSHMVNLAPKEVSGHLVAIYVQEHDPCKKGQLLAQIDPKPYQDLLDEATAQLAVAKANHAKLLVTQRLVENEVPLLISIADKERLIALDKKQEANDELQMVTKEVDASVTAAKSQVDAAAAAFALGQENFNRYERLYSEQSVPQRTAQEATKAYRSTKAELNVAEADLRQVEASRLRIDIERQRSETAARLVEQSEERLGLARLGNLRIDEARRATEIAAREVASAESLVATRRTMLDFTRIVAPFDGVVAKKYRHLGDYVPDGGVVLTIYNPELLYLVANMEETRMPGIEPGSHVDIQLFSFRQGFTGRVAWIGNATGANFTLIPRDVTTSEFTWVVQRVPIRIWLDRDDRWDAIKPGYSARVSIRYGGGDPEWAAKAAAKLAELEGISRGAP